MLRGELFGVPFNVLELALVTVLVGYLVEKAVRSEPFPDPRAILYFWPVMKATPRRRARIFMS